MNKTGFGTFLQTKLDCSLLTRIQAWTTIRTCNIKVCGFQRLFFTANFRSPGSYAPKQLIKGCFHPDLPVQHPKSSRSHHWAAVIKRRKKKKLIWCLDFSTKTGRFEGTAEEKCCHPAPLLDLVSPKGWLEAIWDLSLKSTPLSFLISCSWSILASWHWTRCGRALMEWTWISLSIVGASYMWRTVVCYFNRYE